MFQGMIKTVFQNTLGVDLGEFPVMTYQDAARLYGSDKPDLRVKLEFTELTDVMKDVDFKVFSGAANMKNGRVVALRIPGGSKENGGISRGEIDAYTEFVKIYGAKGLAYIRVIEAFYGWRAGSLALLADAGHNLGDVGGLALGWAGLAAGRLHASDRHTYGWQSSRADGLLPRPAGALFPARPILLPYSGCISAPAPVRSMRPAQARPARR